MQVIVETEPAPGRSYDFNRGDERVIGTLEEAVTLAEKRSVERGRQIVRTTEVFDRTRGWLIQDVDEAAVAAPEQVKATIAPSTTHVVDREGDHWYYSIAHGAWGCGGKGPTAHERGLRNAEMGQFKTVADLDQGWGPLVTPLPSDASL